MVCSACGCVQSEGTQYCRQCGSRLGAAGTGPQAWMPLTSPAYGYAQALPSTRIARNLQPLGLCWMVYGAYRLVEFVVAVAAFHTIERNGLFGDVPPMLHLVAGALLPVISILMGLWTLAAIGTGIALWTRQPWARLLAMVMAFPTMLKLPLGTGLGIYTLWVLAPRASREEWVGLSGGV